MATSKIASSFLITSLLLSLAGFSYSMSQPPTNPVAMEIVRVDYKQSAKALVIDLVVPEVDTIKGLSRIELLISNNNNLAIFGVILNHGDRLDPIPQGNFGLINDPASDDRSVENVSSAAGIPGRWDQTSPHGTLLKQSFGSVMNGNLGISIWIVPQDWVSGRYSIKTRSVKWEHLPSPWQKLAEFDYNGAGVEKVTHNACLIKPIFVNISSQAVMPFDTVLSATLTQYEKQPQDESVVIKRWEGDTASQYKYVEIEQQKLTLSDYPGGFIMLEPGIYQLKHNSVYGQPPSGFFGKSNLFEIKTKDEIIEVKIPLYPAI